ncbi:steroidogenic acute regulatory protein, mitochondrial [Trichonephila inaurata madagascariensis]|uniref:Steroidogenic acute regulatory protein, mitochondrial n=1 Tax=Trichonephila inaurata madagascariensis TaxID=2747483 RepID=A0A8X7BQH7_9ARAC|nr:steroidogenic acute regulatory protein, mitochondrial [Trichonephila inaurata madagascariensis]
MLLHMLYDCFSVLTTDNIFHQMMMQFATHQKPLKKNNFKELADYAISESVRIIKSKGWKEETRIGEDVIYSKTVPNIGKVFKYEGIVDIEAEKINNKLFYNVEKSTEWNNNIEKVDVVETIDNRTNVVHFISKSRLFVSSRDFVHLRAWKKKDDAIIHSSFSINHPKAPPSSYIRAEHRFCTYIMRPLKNDPSRTHLVWLMQVNLKGWLPQHITDHAVTYGMFDHLKDIKSN